MTPAAFCAKIVIISPTNSAAEQHLSSANSFDQVQWHSRANEYRSGRCARPGWSWDMIFFLILKF
jgi:hypothetical protein